MNNFFDTIISSEGLSITSMLICTAASLLLGLGAAAVYRLTTRQPSRNMFVTMLVLPVLIQAVIMLVNGSIGAGVAVMGAFSLVRFRSAPGSSRDICFIFYAVCIGLATGMGYIAFAVVIAVFIGLVLAVVSSTPWFRNVTRRKLLRVLIPENLDYTGIFDDIFDEYLSEHELVQVKTVDGPESTIIELSVGPDDMGKVIGKQGRIAKSIRSVVKAATARSEKPVFVEIL